MTGNAMLISLSSIVVGILILAIPLIVLVIVFKKMKKKNENKLDLDLRVELLEKEVEEIKKHIDYVDQL